MKLIILSATIVLLCSCSSAPKITTYDGGDKGYVVASIIAEDLDTDVIFSISYRNKEKNLNAATFNYVQRSLWSIYSASDRDFDNPDYNGIVEIHTLPPGNYEVYSYQYVYDQNRKISPLKKFAYDFTVTSGEITYLGEYKASGLWGDDCCLYHVKNKVHRDIPLALTKAKIGELKVNEMVPDTNYLGE